MIFGSTSADRWDQDASCPDRHHYCNSTTAGIAKPLIPDACRRPARPYNAASFRDKRSKCMDPAPPIVGIIMGSRSDWQTMRHAADTLDRLGVAHETRIVPAHRTPGRLGPYAQGARERGR